MADSPVPTRRVVITINSGEILLLILLAVVILGPSRLPHYAAKLAQAVRQLRDLAEGAKSQIKNEMGPAFEDVDWRQLDPRQYDPRRIVREALATPPPASSVSATTAPGEVRQASTGARPPGAAAPVHNPTLPTPFDLDAT